MDEGYPRLLGDIGGTNARWAWQETAGAPLENISVLPCQASASLVDSAASYLNGLGHRQPRYAGIGIATAVTGDAVRMTNNAWAFSISEFKHALALQRCLVINDFTALALSLPALTSDEVRQVGQGRAVKRAPIALIGPGTGLGVSGLIAHGIDQWQAISGEGGHVTLPALDAHEFALLQCLKAKFGHVSAERVLSGQGLVDLYEAVCEVQGVSAMARTPSDVTEGALNGNDAQCMATVQAFTGMLGTVAGNLALTLGARGGLYIGGGIVPRLGASFDEAVFRQRFEDKGRFSEYLAPIPSWVITAATPALIGASRALDTLQ